MTRMAMMTLIVMMEIVELIVERRRSATFEGRMNY